MNSALFSQPSLLLAMSLLPKSTQPPAGSCPEEAARRREVENALLVQALCERRPSLTVRVQLLRYIAGELSREQAFADLYSGMA